MRRTVAFFDLIYRLNSRHPEISIVLFLFITSLLLISALNLTPTFNNLDFMPYGSKDRQNIQSNEKDFGTGTIAVIITSPDASDPEIFSMMHKLYHEFQNYDQVRAVESPSELLMQQYNMIPDREIIEQTFLGTPVMPDRSSVIMNIYLYRFESGKGDSISKEMLRIVDFVPKPEGTEVFLYGNPVFDFQMSQSVNQTIALMFISAVGLMILLLYLSSKNNVRGRFMPFAPLLVAVLSAIWVFGILSILKIPLTPVLTAFLPILIGMSVDFGVVIQNRYEEEIQAGLGVPESLRSTIFNTGSGVSMALITTLMGFSSLLLTGVPNLQFFGLALTIGLSTSYIISLVFLTALISLKDRCPFCLISGNNSDLAVINHSGASKSNKKKGFDSFMGWIVNRSARLGLLIMLTGFVIISYGFSNYGNIEFMSDPMDYFPKEMEVNRNMAYLESHFGQGDVIDVVITDKDIRDPAYLEHLLNIERYVSSREDKITASSSLASISDSRFGGIPAGRSQVDSLIEALPRSEGLVLDNSRIVISFNTMKLEGDELGSIVERIRRDIVFYDPFLDFYITGSPVYKESITRGMISGQNIMTLVSFSLVFLILLLINRSVSGAALPMLPILVVVAATIAFMQILKVPHTMLSASINTVIIGTGIDYSIHLIERYKEERRRGLFPIDALGRSWKYMGRSVLTSAATTAGGFIAMTASPYPIFQYFGMVAFVSITFAFLVTIIMLPPLLLMKEGFESNLSSRKRLI